MPKFGLDFILTDQHLCRVSLSYSSENAQYGAVTIFPQTYGIILLVYTGFTRHSRTVQYLMTMSLSPNCKPNSSCRLPTK